MKDEKNRYLLVVPIIRNLYSLPHRWENGRSNGILKNGGGRNSLFPDLLLKLRPIISVAYPAKKKKTATAEI
jgi:hypothetical protein